MFPSHLSPEQSAIVRLLDHLDIRIQHYIRAKQKLIQLLSEQKQAIIQQAVTRGLNPNVRLKPSGVQWLGNVPEHWAVLSLGVLAESIQTGPFGSQLHASEYVTGGIPVVNPSHMRDGQIQADPTISVNKERARILNRHALRPGDVVAARRGELGRCALVGEPENRWLCGTGSLRIRPKRKVLAPAFLTLVLGSQGVRDTLSRSSIGATMDNLNTGKIGRLRLPCPPLDEQLRITAYIRSESERIHTAAHSVQRELTLVREYRARLVADVVTGKLDVRDAADRLPAEVEEVQKPDVFEESVEISESDAEEIEDAPELEEA